MTKTKRKQKRRRQRKQQLHSPEIFAQCQQKGEIIGCSILHNKACAEDVGSRTTQILLEMGARVRNPLACTGTIAERLGWAMAREQSRHVSIDELGETSEPEFRLVANEFKSPAHLAQKREFSEAVIPALQIYNDKLVAKLKPRDRKLLDAVHRDHLEIKTVAARFKMRPNTVTVTLLRIYEKSYCMLVREARRCPKCREYLLPVLKDPKCFRGLVTLARIEQYEGPDAVRSFVLTY